MNRYCLCGASLQVHSSPPLTAEALVALFDRLHASDGHGSATPAQAARVRRREDRRILAEMMEVP